MSKYEIHFERAGFQFSNDRTHSEDFLSLEKLEIDCKLKTDHYLAEFIGYTLYLSLPWYIINERDFRVPNE